MSAGESRAEFEADRFGTAGPRMCAGASPGQTYGKRRIMAMQQRCGAYAEDGHDYCPVHLKASGYLRCATCNAWRSVHQLRACAAPGGTDWRPMACAPHGSRSIVIKTAAGEERLAHWAAFIEDHPPIEPGFYYWNGHLNDLVRDAISWREAEA